ncbi:iron transporter [Pseudoflavonifractor sp. MSJ-30]|uniref:iron transporter n=1 Tax=Pseudoflavonifractor sp. MSJ-30 TaxID=2841525 RepID=UPI001C0F4812|nr:iron transporter [Pseudoflavonifractor sp. MSJ-30]MBU5452246.1 iron transporter [Pseudoflavonifractor sp. MSJ-30]
MKKITAFLLAALLLMALAACGQTAPAETTAAPETTETVAETEAETTEKAADPETTEAVCPLEDGVYTAEFNTDSSMFHANETCDGKGTLTVQDGKMTIHVSLASRSIVNLFPGIAEDAKKEGAELLQPTEDEVTYSDGLTETVYGFDIPVPYLDQEFDLALIGKKGVWYDHKVSVSNPEPKVTPVSDLADGSYAVCGTLEGGTGKTTLVNPTQLTVTNGQGVATVVLSSSKYDYMIVDGVKYEPVTTEGGSTFEIPVTGLDVKIPVVADTVAMSEPHEIEYTILLDSATLEALQ